jgi:hypothetical protein
MYVCHVGCRPAIPVDLTLLSKLFVCNSLPHGGRSTVCVRTGGHTYITTAVCAAQVWVCSATRALGCSMWAFTCVVVWFIELQLSYHQPMACEDTSKLGGG